MPTDLSETVPPSTQSSVPSADRARSGNSYMPRIDIWETEEELVLSADMPGVRAEDLDIQCENRELRIHGKVFPRYQGVELRKREYGVGDFVRSFAIGESIDANKIEAELSNGVLTLHLPKSERLKPRKIKIACN